MLLLQQKRRQKPNHRILRRIEQHAFSQSRIHNRPRRNLQIDPLNKSPPSHFLSSSTLLDDDLQLLLQISPNPIHVLQEFFLFHNRQKFQSHPASQRTTAKSSPMLPRRNCISKFFFRDKRPQRQPSRNRLRNRHNIRSHSKTLKRKHRPSTSQPALNLIKDQSHFESVGQSPALAQKLHRTFMNSAFAKNRLQHNRASVVV